MWKKTKVQVALTGVDKHLGHPMIVTRVPQRDQHQPLKSYTARTLAPQTPARSARTRCVGCHFLMQRRVNGNERTRNDEDARRHSLKRQRQSGPQVGHASPDRRTKTDRGYERTTRGHNPATRSVNVRTRRRARAQVQIVP